MIDIDFVSVIDDEVGEIEGFFLDKKLLCSWCLNDASWRPEYMNPLLESLGYKVIDSYGNKELSEKLKECYL